MPWSLRDVAACLRVCGRAPSTPLLLSTILVALCVCVCLLDAGCVHVLKHTHVTAAAVPCRALDWERKSLAAGLKWNLTEPEREELYRSWGVDPDTKERKLQLVFKLWSKETLG